MKGLKKLLPGFAFFYKFMGYRLFLVLLVSILVSLADGIGLSMFIPLLTLSSGSGQAQNGVGQVQGESMEMFLSIFDFFGMDIALNSVLILMFLLFTIKGVLVFSMYYMSTIFEQFFARNLRYSIIDNLNELKYEGFAREESGRIQNALTGETQKVILAFKTYLKTFQQILMIATYATLAFMSNSEFALFVVVVGGGVNLAFTKLYKKTKSLSTELVAENNNFQTLLLQILSQFKYLSATGAIHRFSTYLKQRVLGIEKTTKHIGVLSSFLIGSREPILVGVVVLTIYLQITVMGGTMTSIIFSLLLFFRALTSVSIFQNSYNRFLSFSGSLDNILSFIDYLKENKAEWGEDSIDEVGDIQLKNLSYLYENTDKGIKKVNLTFGKNKTYAFVGESGSGKSTLANVIVGLLDVQEGDILINGRSIKSYSRDGFTQKVGYITQDPVIFIDSVFNNVTLWEEKSEEALKRFHEVMRQTALMDYVNELEEQEDTQLGLNGLNLSGGQKQRIAIARELYKNVDLIILDEATSALDSGTERFIQSEVQKLSGEVTFFVIAHRLSTIKEADQIFLFEKGKIIANGDFNTLLETSKKFQEMVNLQGV